MARSEFPLKWPKGWPREKGSGGQSKFATSLQKAHKALSLEVQRMGGEAVIISSNVPVLVNGTMRFDRMPVDGGVAVYFTRNGKQMTFACDRWDDVWDNMYSLAKTIEAMRGIERWGASSLMERAFAGFAMVPTAAPPPPPEEDWWKVLGVSRDADIDVIDAVYRTRARKAHPDNGGSTEAMTRLTRARESAKKEKGKL